MTEQEIKSGNELIAVFMGYKFREEYRDEFDEFCPAIWLNTNGHYFSVSEYHTSWDWLMPVVYKIRSVVIEEEDDTSRAKRYSVTGSSIGYITVEGLWQSCIDFIKWHNSLTSK